MVESDLGGWTPESMTLPVTGATSVGWDQQSLTNETVDEHGNLVTRNFGFAIADPHAPARRAYDDREVVALRDRLREHNGLVGLEICDPTEVERAARIFRRDGFVVVRDLLDDALLNRWRVACGRVLETILSIPASHGRRYQGETGRLSHRYSYGTCSASRQMMHDADWAAMIDLPTTTPILREIFGSADYLVWGGGGDLCLPGAIEYQHLHADFSETHAFPEGRLAQARNLGIELDANEAAALDLATQRLVIERTPALVTINFLMSDLTWENGPIRQIPGTHARREAPPAPADEPDWMRYSTLVGAPAGAGVFRDNRAWHGGTPNVSREVRSMPNIEYVAPWFPRDQLKTTMPHELWTQLSPHAQRLCRFIRTEPGVWPSGAGVMHPLASMRRAAQESSKAL